MMRHLITIREKDLRSIIKESVTKVLSEVYQGILDNNGEGELQKAALKNGFNYIAYHNTDNDNLTFFDVRTSGIHFGSKKAADERGEVRYYGSHTNEYFLKIVKPYVIEKDFDWEQQSIDVDFMNDEEYGEWRKETTLRRKIHSIFIRHGGIQHRSFISVVKIILRQQTEQLSVIPMTEHRCLSM